MRSANGISRDRKTPIPAKELGRGLTIPREADGQEQATRKILVRPPNLKTSANSASELGVHIGTQLILATTLREDLGITSLERSSERSNGNFMKPKGELGLAIARQIRRLKPSPRASAPGLVKTRQPALCWRNNLSGKGK